MIDRDAITAGGIPPDALEARMARRRGVPPSERPTQPIVNALGDMPAGSPCQNRPPPSHERALDLARAFLGGPESQRVVGRDGCEEMARWILTTEARR